MKTISIFSTSEGLNTVSFLSIASGFRRYPQPPLSVNFANDYQRMGVLRTLIEPHSYIASLKIQSDELASVIPAWSWVVITT